MCDVVIMLSVKIEEINYDLVSNDLELWGQCRCHPDYEVTRASWRQLMKLE